MIDNDPRVSDADSYDPTFRNARREAIVILAAWLACLIWSLSVSIGLGYGAVDGPIDTVLGIPAWVFWGIVVPWLAADVFALWFCFAFMANDELGELDEPEERTEDGTTSHAESAEPGP